ncbi:MAG: hypothetical protein K1060chlam5_00031 [Candidatus Anoxychlamydiales bacterium]|nr:hypothetical protein [Candidatus Anoxychlamydiales bacterium]
MKNNYCPCHSKKLYKNCCKTYHEGTLAKNALQLMRSRYSAYALNLVDYIIKTTSLENPSYKVDLKKFSEEVLEFCLKTKFEDLKILDFFEKENFATVTFKAYLFQNNQDISFVEKSYFEKVNNRWLYKYGEIIKDIPF